MGRELADLKCVDVFDRERLDRQPPHRLGHVARGSLREHEPAESVFDRDLPRRGGRQQPNGRRIGHKFAIALHRQPPHLGLIDALAAAIAATTPPPHLVERDLRRGRIMLATPSLAGALRQYEEHLEQQFAQWIAQRLRRPVDDFEVRVVAGMSWPLDASW